MAARPTPEDRDALSILTHQDQLTEWEEVFLESLDDQLHWTPRQAEKFDEVWHRHME